MRSSSSYYASLAVACLIATARESAFVDAFTPTNLLVSNSNGNSIRLERTRKQQNLPTAAAAGLCLNNNQSSSRLYSFLGMQDDEEDEDSDDEDSDGEEGDEELVGSMSSSSSSPFGLKLDPWDPNPVIKPRPSRYFKNELPEKKIDDSKLKQTMSDSEREENLTVLRQLRKNDLPDLRRRKDHAGWVEANNDLKRRLDKDPWFDVNARLRDAVQLGQPQAEIDRLLDLANNQCGGPPPGVTITASDANTSENARVYAVHTEIYDIPLSEARAASMMEREIRNERAARGKALMAERQANLDQQQRQFEDDLRNPGLRADKEAKERRERTMRRLYAEIEEDNKKKRDRAKEILGKVPDTPESRTKAMEKALKEARDELKSMRRKAMKGGSDADVEDSDVTSKAKEDLEKSLSGSKDSDSDSKSDSKSSAQKAREAATAEASGGRPRLPGDTDVTQGEVTEDMVESGSTTTSGPLEVKVSSVYNSEQSDPPMRKHCFQYTIQITNNSKDNETLQLLGRRFEIQTVGASMKDVVEGEGVTGRTPVLKPGESFEYTSTAPLSVRPIGTTIIAARMRGEYRYVVLKDGEESASEKQKEDGPTETAELGMFHFVFPEDQRVQPFRGASEDDKEEDEEDEEDDADDTKAEKSSPAKSSSSSSSSTSSSTAPASTLPGDSDIQSGSIDVKLNDSSEEITDNVRVAVTTSYRPERSDERMDKHCFAYNIRITNEDKKMPIQLVSRRFEIQTIGSVTKDVVQGPGVTGRQPILQPGESFEYTSTAPLSVKPLLDKTPVVARMQGEYNFVQLADDGTTPISSTPLQAKLGMFHFILPAMT